MKQIVDYQKESLSLILKAMDIPEEDPHGDFTDKETKIAEEIEDEEDAGFPQRAVDEYMDRREDERFRYGPDNDPRNN